MHANAQEKLPSTEDIMTCVFSYVKDYGKLAGQIPSEDYDYHLAFKGFRRHVSTHSEFLVELMNKCTQLLPERRRMLLAPERTPIGTSVLPELQRNAVMEAIDSLLENVDSALDEVRGQRMHAAAQLGMMFGASVAPQLHGTDMHDMPSSTTSSEQNVNGGNSNNKNNVCNLTSNANSGTRYYGRALTIKFEKQVDESKVGRVEENSTSTEKEVESGSKTNNDQEVHGSISYKYGLGSGNEVVRLAHVLRPQLTFVTPVDNSDTPFVPHYADADGAIHTGTAGVHPFRELITTFTIPPRQLMAGHDQIPLPLSECPLYFVDEVQQLRDMVHELITNCTEVAIDLEHHDYYSYQGFTCLMQISSRTADYVVDCIRLRHEMHLLSPLLLNHNILKVLHGAKEDVRWLQKDFGLYLVNFFDTGVALQTLHMPHSLAFAVDHFCQVKLDKKYQTADWRVRPLPAEMVHYARSDTHYLLYIYDRLKSLLLNSESRIGGVGNVLMHVYHESRRLALEQYCKPHLDSANSYKIALGRSLAGLNARQEFVARDVYNWRDRVARDVDDSPMAVMHVSSILAIASQLPRTASEVLRCCHPVSATLRSRITSLVQVIQNAANTTTITDNASYSEEETMHATNQKLQQGSNNVEERNEEKQEEESHEQVKRSNATNEIKSHLHQRTFRGVHRTMTGTLPSIEFPLHGAISYSSTHINKLHFDSGDSNTSGDRKEVDSDHKLTDTKPSSWIISMQSLSQTLRHCQSQQTIGQLEQEEEEKKNKKESRLTMTHNIPLPGSAILTHLRKQYEAERAQKLQQDRREEQSHKANTSNNIFRIDHDNIDNKTEKEGEDDFDTKNSVNAKDDAGNSLQACEDTKLRKDVYYHSKTEILEQEEEKTSELQTKLVGKDEESTEMSATLSTQNAQSHSLEEKNKLQKSNYKEDDLESKILSGEPVAIRKAYGKRGNKKRQRS